MRVVLVGAGGVGGCLGVRLAETGHDVAWLARGRSLAALRESGIALESPQGEVRMEAEASDEPAALGPADAVIVTTKLYDLETLAPRLAPLVGPETVVLPVQNGIDSWPILSGALRPEAVLKGTISIKSYLAAPGRVVCKSPFAKLRFAEADSGHGPAARRLADALNACTGVSATLSEDIDADLWHKFLMLSSFSAVVCMARATIGEVLDSPEATDLVVEAAREATAVGRAEGVNLPGHEAVADLVHSQVKDMPRDGRASMLEDLEAGRPLELRFLSGAVVRLGERHGIPTPVHGVALRALAMHADGHR